jgi:hypothetical protein
LIPFAPNFAPSFVQKINKKHPVKLLQKLPIFKELCLLPITFIRQVLACVTCPSLVEPSATGVGQFPIDVRERARELLEAFGGGRVGIQI